jgi:hypothetical protein
MEAAIAALMRIGLSGTAGNATAASMELSGENVTSVRSALRAFSFRTALRLEVTKDEP